MSTVSGQYDVVVIGSGFGGAVSASALTNGGAKVLLVERGPWRDTQPVREAGIEDRKPLPYGCHFYSHLLHRVGTPLTRGTGWRINRYGLFDLHYTPDMTILCSNGVGGGSHVYSAMNVRPGAADYWDGHVSGVSAEGMEPHYAWMIHKMGARAPAPEDQIPNAVYQRFKDSRDFTADSDISQPAMAVRMEGHPDDYKSNSFLGSKNGAKATLDRVLLVPAVEKGLSVAALHECLGIRKQASGEYLLDMVDHSKKRRCCVKAGKVVLAAGTLNTMRLLFRSREIGGLQGMPALGLGFGGNGDVPAYWAVNQPGADFSIGTPCHGRFALRDTDTGRPMPGPDLTSYGLNGIDDIPLPAFLKHRLKRDLVLVGMGADKADGVLAWRNGKLRCRYIRQNSRILARINASLDEIARRSGASVWYSERKLLTVHPLGGARLADHPDSGVVNAQGSVHGHPGLYVADAAALPAAPDAPPSMTISAWSRHVAEGILAQTNPSENVEPIRQKTTADEKVA